MIHTIGEILRGKFSGFSYVDKHAGIVQTVTRKKGNNVVSKFPVACNVEGVDCDDVSKLKDLVPDDTKKSVLYFEDLGGSVYLGKEGNNLKFSSRLRLVGWLNLNKLGKTDCSITSSVVAHLITRIESTNEINHAPFTRLKVQVENQLPKDPNIFSKYTYATEKVQFLIYPYDYFAINFKVIYSLNKNCVPEFDAGNEIECKKV